jgi:hypothetical protein
MKVPCFVRVMGVAVCVLLFISTPADAGEISVPLANTSFEMPSAAAGDVAPADWFLFASTNAPHISVTVSNPKHGLQCCKFQAQTETDAYQGIAQRFSPVQGKSFTFTAYVRADTVSPITGDAFGQISLEWQDANSVEISRVYGPTWGKDLSATQWNKFTVEAVAPENAYFGVAVITFFSKNSAGTGVFYVDEVELKYKE